MWYIGCKETDDYVPVVEMGPEIWHSINPFTLDKRKTYDENTYRVHDDYIYSDMYLDIPGDYGKKHVIRGWKNHDTQLSLYLDYYNNTTRIILWITTDNLQMIYKKYKFIDYANLYHMYLYSLSNMLIIDWFEYVILYYLSSYKVYSMRYLLAK
jgi:hypothetical protein